MIKQKDGYFENIIYQQQKNDEKISICGEWAKDIKWVKPIEIGCRKYGWRM
jgi:hypothetical protein